MAHTGKPLPFLYQYSTFASTVPYTFSLLFPRSKTAISILIAVWRGESGRSQRLTCSQVCITTTSTENLDQKKYPAALRQAGRRRGKEQNTKDHGWMEVTGHRRVQHTRATEAICLSRRSFPLPHLAALARQMDIWLLPLRVNCACLCALVIAGRREVPRPWVYQL